MGKGPLKPTGINIKIPEKRTLEEKNEMTSPYGGVAQLGEHLPCKQGVKGSNPFISTQACHSGNGGLDCTLKTTHWKRHQILIEIKNQFNFINKRT